MTIIRVRTMAASALTAAGVAGCYVVPVAPDGTPLYPYQYPYTPAYSVVPYPATASAPAGAPVVRGAPPPAVINARLYPANEIASREGMITGSVTNLMNGRGRFTMDYHGELLSGEATRVDGDERRGVASAYGQRGTYMTCEYRMTSAVQGAGMCRMSNGAEFQVHLGG
jgi:hypothetical protein